MNINADSRADGARQPSNHFARTQFEWLRQVAYDGALPSSSSRVAAALTYYFNRKHDGWAWMSQSTLAQKLGMAERTVRSALSALVERGHLVRKRRGKEETNLYRLQSRECDRQESAAHDRKESAGHIDEVTGTNQQSDRQKSAKVTGRNLPPNPLSEPLEEPIEGKPSPKMARDSIPKKTRRRQVQAPWPDGYHLGDELVEYAEKKAGWDLSRALAEFERFQNYHLGKGSMFADWNAAWRMWVQNGAKFDLERAKQNQAGTVIDNDTGNVLHFPGGTSRQQSRSAYHRRSNTDLAFEMGDDDDE